MKKISKDYIFLGIVILFGILLSLFFCSENPLRLITILSSLILLFCFYFFSKNIFLSSFLYILITLPFNITFQIPQSVQIFGNDILLYNPYVEGVYVNYLVPTLSILDLGVILLLLSSLLHNGWQWFVDIFKRYGIVLPLFVVFLWLQNVLLNDPLSFLNSARLILYILGFLSLLEFFKEGKKKYLEPLLVVSVISVLIQGIIGILQFTVGSSLGLGFLGESQVVSGMQGSSFVTLGGEVFLRAYGTFPHPNLLAGYLLFNILLALTFINYENGKCKILPYILLLLSLTSLLFTFSRVSILLAVLVLIVYFGAKIIKGKLFVFSLPLFFERFVNLFSSGDTSWEDRVKLVRSSLRIIKENWLSGIGIGNFVKGMEGDVPRSVNNVLLLQPVHNFFLLIFSELGLIGFGLYMWLLVDVCRKNIVKITLFGVLVLVCIFVLISFDHYSFSLPQGIMLLFLLLLLLF